MGPAQANAVPPMTSDQHVRPTFSRYGPISPSARHKGREPSQMFGLTQAWQATADLVQWSREEGSLPLTPAIELSESEQREQTGTLNREQ